MTRRELFPAMAAAAVVPPALPALAGETTTLRQKFEEWQRVHAWACSGPADDAECDRRTDVLIACEDDLFAHPAQSMTDLAIKLTVMARADFMDIAGQASLEADARRILGDNEIPH